MIDLKNELEKLEDKLIRDALKLHNYHLANASEYLGLGCGGNLFNRMKKLNIKTPKQLAKELQQAKEGKQ